MIDDFSISGVNDSCEAESKIDLHRIDTFCSLVRCYFEGCGAHGATSSLQRRPMTSKVHTGRYQ